MGERFLSYHRRWQAEAAVPVTLGLAERARQKRAMAVLARQAASSVSLHQDREQLLVEAHRLEKEADELERSATSER